MLFILAAIMIEATSLILLTDNLGTSPMDCYTRNSTTGQRKVCCFCDSANFCHGLDYKVYIIITYHDYKLQIYNIVINYNTSLWMTQSSSKN